MFGSSGLTCPYISNKCVTGIINSLRWRHYGRDSVSNHQSHDCLLNRLFRRRSKKTSKLRATGLCVWNSPGTGEFPAQMASDAENVSIWWCHHVEISKGVICGWSALCLLMPWCYSKNIISIHYGKALNVIYFRPGCVEKKGWPGFLKVNIRSEVSGPKWSICPEIGTAPLWPQTKYSLSVNCIHSSIIP